MYAVFIVFHIGFTRQHLKEKERRLFNTLFLILYFINLLSLYKNFIKEFTLYILLTGKLDNSMEDYVNIIITYSIQREKMIKQLVY